jgi:hypothetical protein
VSAHECLWASREDRFRSACRPGNPSRDTGRPFTGAVSGRAAPRGRAARQVGVLRAKWACCARTGRDGPPGLHISFAHIATAYRIRLQTRLILSRCGLLCQVRRWLFLPEMNLTPSAWAAMLTFFTLKMKGVFHEKRVVCVDQV